MQYYIENGVRRAVAAREVGLQKILAELFEQGKKSRLILVDLSDLHSPKSSIGQSDGRYVKARQGMGAALSRAKVPPIDVQPLGDKGQKATIPLNQVALIP